MSLDDSDLNYIKQGYAYAKSHTFDTVCKNLETIYKDVAHPIVNNRPCFFPYYTTSVTWDGKVYPCCIYFDGQITFGDLSKQSFKQIWNGDIYQKFRNQLREDRDALPLCRSCPLVDVGINNVISKYMWINSLVNKLSKRNFHYIQRDNNIC
jgi:radical SAM protein with 4Fe4S-binding SPASM domain